MAKIETLLETVTPAIAKRYLQNNPKNRLFKPRLVEQLARDIADGDFHLTHQGIAFADNGDLLDGQHRLMAIVKADKPVQLYVTRSLPAEAMNIIDVGSKRTHADALMISGYGSGALLAGCAQIYWGFLNETHAIFSQRGRIINNIRLLEFIKDHPEIVQAAEWINHNKSVKQLGSPALVAGFYAILHHKNRNKAREFFKVLTENYSDTKHHPALILNEHILRRKAQGMSIPRRYLAAAIIRCWNNFLAKEFVSNIVIKDPLEVIKEFK